MTEYTKIACPDCRGNGLIDIAYPVGTQEWRTCTTCKGEKFILKELPPPEPRYPEHAKLDKRQLEHYIISDFFDWLGIQPENEGPQIFTDAQIRGMIYRYLRIDPVKLEEERLQMLRDQPQGPSHTAVMEDQVNG